VGDAGGARVSERQARIRAASPKATVGGVMPADPITATRPVPRGPSALGLAWRQYRLERRLFWRNPSAAFFNFLLPLLFLAFFGAILHGRQHDLNVIVPGIAGMSVMSTTFTALAFNMTFLREQGVLKRIRGTPMPGGSYLLGIAGNAVTNTALQIAIITIAGRVFFGTGWPKDWIELIVFVAAGVICFASLGVAFSHAIPNFDSAPAYVNAVFLPVIFVSGVFYDAAKAPGFIKGIAQALPLKHLIDGLSGAMVRSHSGLGHNISALGVIAAWAVLGIALAIRGFSWEQRRS
jgi:ABC-2 type transport system permease protein